MQNIIIFLLMVVIGGLIGYLTNRLAIKMLFRPINPIRLGIFTLQGVFPKRKDQMAKSLAKTIEEELLSDEAIFKQLFSEENKQLFKQLIIEEISSKIMQKIPPMVKMLLGQDFDSLIASFIDNDADELFQSLIAKWQEQGGQTLDIYTLVKARIDELDFEEFERILFGLMNKELRFVEVIGLFLGMMIGALQFVITSLF